MGAMAPVATPEPPVSSSGPDPCDDVDTMQKRLALLGKVIFVISLGFFVVGYVVNTVLLRIPVEMLLVQSMTYALAAGSLTMGLLWLVCARRLLPIRVLGVLEVGSLLLSCACWAFVITPNDAGSLGTALLGVSITVIARAILVPSTAGRTLWLTLLASAPVLVVQYLRLPFHPILTLSPWQVKIADTINAALWIVAATGGATVASHVIYGLRREVAAARDIGQYTLEQKLGSGGMGEVWRARHRLLIRPAALKLIRREALGSHPGGSDVVLRRFEREARATAALKSPHTVQLYDFGVTDDGTLYYVMELLEGVDLETLVRRFGPVPAERVLRILEQACHSLMEAHDAGLVHRDIKPANLFLIRAGSKHDFVKVLDFGMVKLGQTREGSEALKLTGMGVMAGTPAYMSPEVVLGEARVDLRADLYSLGCVGYWLLTGRLVFEGDTAMKVMLAHAHDAPPAPSTRTELPIPAALERIILDCLAKDPTQRPASAGELAERLEACEVATPWTAERAEKWWRVHLPEPTQARPLSDVLLSQEVRRPVVKVRPGRRRVRP
jgi:serine/threonine-protein kinase